MDGIKKYSKEWFTMNGTENRFNAINNLQDGVGKLAKNKGYIDKSVFIGTKEEIEQKYKSHSSGIHGSPSGTQLSVQKYGMENIINALDADGDGEITEEEVNAVAALNAEDESNFESKCLSAEDLDILYQNALSAVDSVLEVDGNVMNFSYADGSKTTLTTDEDDNIIKSTETSVNEDGSKTVKTNNYEKNSQIVSQYDSEGRLLSKEYDYEGELNDKTQTYTYNDDGSKTMTVETIGKKVVTEYDKDGKIVSKTTDVKYNSDGKIGNTKQQSIGDCWVLAGVNALNFSEKGQQLIQNAITHNDDGSVTVKLVGGGKEYTFSAEEIALNQYEDGSKKYSTGDTDMNLIEMAIGKYRKENYENEEATIIGLDRAHHKPLGATEENPLETGMVDEAVYLLTGTNSEYWINPRIINADKGAEKLLDKFQDNPEDYAGTCSFKKDDTSITDGRIVDSHVYSIKSVDEENVYIVNPWDSSKTIAYPRDKFVDNLNELSLTDLDEATTASVLDSEKTSAKIEETVIHELGKVDGFVRPKIEKGVEKAKDIASDAKEFVSDAKDVIEEKAGKVKNFFKNIFD